MNRGVVDIDERNFYGGNTQGREIAPFLSLGNLSVNLINAVTMGGGYSFSEMPAHQVVVSHIFLTGARCPGPVDKNQNGQVVLSAPSSITYTASASSVNLVDVGERTCCRVPRKMNDGSLGGAFTGFKSQIKIL
jgi:hypothetical protein